MNAQIVLRKDKDMVGRLREIREAVITSEQVRGDFERNPAGLLRDAGWDLPMSEEGNEKTHLSDYLMTAPEGVRLAVLESVLAVLEPLPNGGSVAVDDSSGPEVGMLALVAVAANIAVFAPLVGLA